MGITLPLFTSSVRLIYFLHAVSASRECGLQGLRLYLIRVGWKWRNRFVFVQSPAPRTAAGRTGYFTIAAVLLILSGLTVIGVVNPPQHNPPPKIVVISAMVAFFVFPVAFFVMGMFSQSCTLILFRDALVRASGGATEIVRWSDDGLPDITPTGSHLRFRGL